VAPSILKDMATGRNFDDRLRPFSGKHVPGIAAAIVGADGIRATGAAGRADIVAGTSASVGMVCPWFSMTKIATATTAMRLVDQGHLDLDAPVIEHVPQIGRLSPAVDARRITARHLLSHSAGIPNPIPVRWIHPADHPPPDPDTFLDGLLAKHAKLRFEPGARSSYSNLGTLALGAALADLAGKPYVDLVRDELLRPLGMTRTAFAYSDDMQASAATGYHPRWSPMRPLLPRWVIGTPSGRWISFNRFLLDGSAYGGLVGPVEDAARFLQMHLRDGELDGARILTSESASTMREITMNGARFDLGLGWFRPSDRRDAEPAFVEHLGGGAGFFNVIRIYPSLGVGIAVMGNATKYDIDGVATLAIAVASP
jgi:CubicO group peptidase (beta-lactamase class C family)